MCSEIYLSYYENPPLEMREAVAKNHEEASRIERTCTSAKP
jgi:hypothetical protein